MASACVCGEYFNVDESGQLCLNPGTMGLRKIVRYTQPGTYQFRKADYPWLARIRVLVQGAGGGSGGAESDKGQLISRPGAASGGYSEALIEVGDLGDVETVVVGAGGKGGTGNNPGTAGGTSAFGGHASAGGGDAGTANMESGTDMNDSQGVGGPLAGTGDYAIGGGAGGSCIRLNGSHGLSGAGGDSQMGFGVSAAQGPAEDTGAADLAVAAAGPCQSTVLPSPAHPASPGS